MEWLFYLLEANLYLVVFYIFYRLFLQNETFYHLNRYYLLTISIIAFILPVLQVGLLKPAQVAATYQYIPQDLVDSSVYATVKPMQIQEPIDFSQYLYPIYLMIAGFFALKLLVSLFKIIKLWIKAKKQKTGVVTFVELKEKAAFSFFNLLFIHPHLAEKETVLKHEMVHIKQKHSFDILFFEVLQVICWFNPLLHFLKKDVKLLHEYIADEQSSSTNMKKHEYAMFLIEHSFGVVPTALTNQIFNQSILKRRINMLNKKRTASSARLKLLLPIPLCMGMLCISTLAFTKDYGYIDLLPEKSEMMTTIIQNPPQAEQNDKKTYTTKSDSIVEVRIAKKRPNKERFYPAQTIKDGKSTNLEKRHIVINGDAVDKKTFTGVENASKIIYLNSTDGVKKYGDKAKFGAVEIYGDHLQHVALVDKLTTSGVRVVNGVYEVPATTVRGVRINPTNIIYTTVGTNVNVDTANGVVYAATVNERPIKVRGYAISSDSLKEVRITRRNDSVRYARSFILRTSMDMERSSGKKLSFNTGSKQKSITVYDQSGNPIYQNNNYKDDWDGKKGNVDDFKGKDIPSGTYYYMVITRGENVEANTKRGYVVLK